MTYNEFKEKLVDVLDLLVHEDISMEDAINHICILAVKLDKSNRTTLINTLINTIDKNPEHTHHEIIGLLKKISLLEIE